MSPEPMEEMMTDHTLARRRRPLGLEVRGLDDYLRLAEVLAKSELVPVAYRNKPADVLLAMAMGAELGFGPAQSLQAIYVVGGRPSLYVEAAVALVRASGELESLSVEGDDIRATATATRRGQGSATITFAFEDATRLGLTRAQGGPWTTQRGWMLQTRAIGRVLHRLFPDLLKGVGLSDPLGRAVEQGEPGSVDLATGEILEGPPPKPNGSKLAALTERLAAQSGPSTSPAPGPAPPVASDSDPEPTLDLGPDPLTEASGMERTLVLSLIQTNRDKVTPHQWAVLLRKHQLSVSELGRADLVALREFEQDLKAVVASTTKGRPLSNRPEPA